jgi:sporulation protein YlmC with PRC-barrel domain
MTQLTSILGKGVVSRADAEDQGKIVNVVVDVHKRVVAAWQVGKGRKASFADHGHLTGIGDAAAVLDDAVNLRPASEGLEEAVVKGHRDFLGATVLTEAGDVIGKVTDAEIDTDSGAIITVRADGLEIVGTRLLGFGSFALVVSVPV